MCVNINKAFNVMCSQSLCEVVVNSCRELELQSSFVLRVSSCSVFTEFVSLSSLLESRRQLLFAL